MTDRQTSLQHSLASGLAYLLGVQRADGGFDSFSSASMTPFKKEFTYQTTFVPAVILAALSKIQTVDSQLITRQLVSFIKAQRSPASSFNYWSVASPERTVRPYPDDLDDTACALIGLFLHDPGLIGPEVLAAFIKLLLATETRVGGPYRTWLVPAGSAAEWLDVDVAVNANVAYFLSLVSQPLPNITALLEQAIRDKRLISPYYASTYSLVYYLARAYKGPLTGDLRKLAQHLRLTGQRTSLQNALLLSTLLQLDDPNPARVATDLLAAQKPDGSWPAEAFCLDPAREGITYYHGGECLTTALALEALQAYKQFTGKPSKITAAPAAKTIAHNHPAFQATLSSRIRQDWRTLKPELRATSSAFLQNLAKASGDTAIMMLPKAFNKSLARPLPKTQEPMLVQLGLANLYGWAAYTIYDDFLDDEGQPALLPVATTALRYCLEAFDKALPEDQEFRALVRQTFDTIDGANAWELAHCRFERHGPQLLVAELPDYGDLTSLAERSLGHSLAPLAVLQAKGVKLNSRLFHDVRQAFIHYLAARQLNDDAHDWQTDLQNGHITYVVTRLLANAHIKPGRYTWDKLLPLVQKQFWHDTLPQICQDISRQTMLSRQSLGQFPELQYPNVLTTLLDNIDASVVETLATQRQTQSFLSHYTARPQAAGQPYV